MTQTSSLCDCPKSNLHLVSFCKYHWESLKAPHQMCLRARTQVLPHQPFGITVCCCLATSGLCEGHCSSSLRCPLESLLTPLLWPWKGTLLSLPSALLSETQSSCQVTGVSMSPKLIKWLDLRYASQSRGLFTLAPWHLHALESRPQRKMKEISSAVWVKDSWEWFFLAKNNCRTSI